MGVRRAANAGCSLLPASRRLIGAKARKEKSLTFHNRNYLATTAVEERICRGSLPGIRFSCTKAALCLHPSVSHYLDTDLLRLLFFLLFPLASVLLKQDHIYQNITRIRFLEDEEIHLSPQDFTR